jgi:hypothetical protein
MNDNWARVRDTVPLGRVTDISFEDDFSDSPPME